MTAVFFDVDGTLVRWNGEYAAIVSDAFERNGVSPADEWVAHYDDRFFHHFGEFAADPYYRAFADVCDRFAVDAGPRALADALVAAEFEAVEPVPGTGTLLPDLADEHALGILTNGVPAVQFQKVERVGLADYFDVRVASHDPAVRATKPEPRIFEAARDRVSEHGGSAPDVCVMVGDDHEADVAGAREQGFEAVHVDPAEGVGADAFRELGLL